MVRKLKKPVSSRVVGEIVRSAFGSGEKIRKITKLTGGLFNTSCRVDLFSGRSVVVRLSPPERKKLLSHEKGFLQREAAIGRVLRKRGVPVPELLWQDFSQTLIRRDILVTEFCPGENWFSVSRRLSKAENARLYQALGALAERIHKPAEKCGFGFPPPGRRRKTWGAFIHDLCARMEKDVQAFSRAPFPQGRTLLSLAKKMTADLDAVKEPYILHGDLWPRNVLVKKEKGRYVVSALLDCERGLFGDPEFEWVFHCLDLPEAFFKGYGKQLSPGREARRRRLLYKAYYLLNASLEEILHFGREKRHLLLFQQALAQMQTLLKELS